MHLAGTCESKQQALEDCLQRLARRRREERLTTLRERIQAVELSGNHAELAELLREVAQLTTRGDLGHGTRESEPVVQQAR